MAGIVGSISIKDSATAVLKTVRAEQEKLRESAVKTGSTLKETYDKSHTLKLKTEEARKKVKGVITETKKLHASAKGAVLKVKDKASDTVKKVKGKLSELHKKHVKPVIDVVDKASGKVRGIVSVIGKAAKAVAIPLLAVGAIGAAMGGASIGAGLSLEQQQISIEHFVGATNRDMSAADVKSQSKSYIEELRQNANATPFETGEVIEAGSRAVALSGGSVRDAMKMVTLAEDMAAASGGTKSIMDAMEALGDLKVGETERLKEFGVKVSADEYKEKGFEGVSGDLKSFYGGASEKLAGSGSGLLSTISGKLKSSSADFGLGIVEEMKPVLKDIITLIDEAEPHIKKMSAAFGGTLSSGIKLARGAVSDFQPVVDKVLPLVSGAFKKIEPVIQNTGTIFSAVMGGISTAVSAIAPVVIPIWEQIAEKVGGVIEFLAERSGFIEEVIGTAGSAIAEVIETAWSVAGPVLDLAIAAFELIFTIAQKVWPGVQSLIEGAWSIISPIFDALGAGAEMLAGAFEKVRNFIENGGVGGGTDGGGRAREAGRSGKRHGRNARGTNHWRGGTTWVGEEGPELIDLPRGTRVLPSKESAAITAKRPADIIPIAARPKSPEGTAGGGKHISITISKIADTVVVRSDEDKDELAELTAKRIVEALDNIA